jgi:hypothetical protein
MTELSQVDIERARKRSVTADDIMPISGAARVPFTVLMGPIGLLDQPSPAWRSRVSSVCRSWARRARDTILSPNALLRIDVGGRDFQAHLEESRAGLPGRGRR